MRALALLSLILVLSSPLSLSAKERGKRTATSAAQSGVASSQEVLGDFEKILDLWRDGSYDELYRRTTGGRESKETFARKLSAAPRRPACCWEKMQDVEVSSKGEGKAVVRARLGFEGSVPGTQFVTKSIKLQKEGSVWAISQSDLLSLADYSKKRKLYRYLPVQQK
ncbi:hypothetical protein Gbem_3551 [Citrifermentans bemidjiense Bem]|uniref:Nuclear transport factor 2 family protein n=1 Tax=Citrifermentans bemidjiense (strain ATCC BAA-1014 / DSM 16622 / JCM 12645 / Bem) TaxID=404380 RepID=B5EC87_CITBB|nr:hypothetical protein [Citrifermentans bemidjiense]ACH40543.1 hypothetical protein Gbem_3551 [Citrifermentans bemidjiense Bem]